MIKNNKDNDVASDKVMWQNVDGLSDTLGVFKDEHPEMYWVFMCRQHSILYGKIREYMTAIQYGS